MTRMWLVVVLLSGAALVHAAARQDSVSMARELYTTAAYDEALAMLDRLRSASPSEEETRTIEQYRAFSLVALGRTADAEKAIEAIVALDPTWVLADSEAPPRIIGLFATVRERALAGLLRQRFAAAKALYNEKRHDEAVEAFSSLILLLEHPSIAKVASVDASNLQTVAAGFRDLAKAASEQAKLAAEEAAKAAAAAAAAKAAEAASTPGGGESTAPGSAGPGSASVEGSNGVKPKAAEPVLPPSIITQQVPRPMGVAVPSGSEAVVILDVLVDELGRVERATVRQSANRAYEAQLIAATRGWRYTPATQAGKPVKYVKTLEITLTPR